MSIKEGNTNNGSSYKNITVWTTYFSIKTYANGKTSQVINPLALEFPSKF